MKMRWVSSYVAASLCSMALAQHPIDVSAAGRKVAASQGGAVVTVRLVKKTTAAYEGQSSTRDSNGEMPGVVINPNGLTVTSLMAGDPNSMFGDGAGEGMSSRSEITEAKLILANGDEIPAKVVLRDKDLDLMFLRPITKPAKPMQAIDLRHSAQPSLLDPMIVLTRLGKVVNRTLGAKLLYVQAVVQKPRKRYVVSSESVGEDFGSPVLSLDGRVVGLLVVKMAKMSADSMEGPQGYSENMAAIVVTAADLLKTAVQAPEDATKPAMRKSVKGTLAPQRVRATKNMK